eukprot:Skav206884  [mRNA]  locus=scaffold3287:13187:18436:- [translate_table: standard]
MTDSKWEMAARRPEASLSHCTCPWGGHLVRFDNRTAASGENIFIQNAPEDPRDFLIRPEVRGLYEASALRVAQAKSEIAVHWRETLAPGEAVLERSSSMWVVKMASVLFGNFQGPLHLSPMSEVSRFLRSNFFYDNLPTLARHQLRRDFPQPGDCTYVAPEMREMDSQMYIVLCMRSFNRGPPMVPHSSGEVTITSGKDMGRAAAASRRTSPPGLASALSPRRDGFCLAEYLKLFMSQLGHALTTYETLDCCKLVPYQCVVKRSDWERLREPFTQAFRLQKAAYRRANGGTTAPALLEDVKPHFSTRRHVHSGDLTAVVVKTVVRKTFLELEEDVEVGPPMRRTKSDVSDVISLL